MSTKQNPEKETKPSAKPDTKSKVPDTKSDDEQETDALNQAPQTDPNYKPDQNVLTDNRRSDYDQPYLNNPESQAIHRDTFEDGGEGDKPENHKGDKAWDINVKEDDEANKKEAEKEQK